MKTISGLSILLVEDEYLIALDAEEMLNEMGAAAVKVVSTIEDAQVRIAEGGFDLAILDVNLNGRMSTPLAEALRGLGIPIVFTTGYSLRHRPIAGLEDCICVNKPYTAQRLKEGVSQALLQAAV